MSQPSTRFDSESYNPSTEQQQRLTQADLDDLFGTTVSEQPDFSSVNSPAFGDVNFTLGNPSLEHGNSSTPSTAPTPDFTNYNISQSASAYPTPGPISPHPYPLEQQHVFHTSTSADVYSHSGRPLPFRSQTNTAYLHPAHAQQGRRRSLSHGDADRIAAANGISNPTFVRLQAPRARSVTPEEKRRSAPYTHHGRSASQGLEPRVGRPMKLTSSPYLLQPSPLGGSILATPIGTPLDELSSEDEGYQPGGHQKTRRRPIIRQMIHPAQLARSRKIIEIGAMAVSSRLNLDRRLEQHTAMTDRERIMKKVTEIEQYLQAESGDNAAALRGCAMIRQALDSKEELDVKWDITNREEAGRLEAPSTVFSEMDYNMYDGGDGGNELMGLLMQETGRTGSQGAKE